MARWRRRGPRVELPAWVLDPATDDDLAWQWAEDRYLDGDPNVWFEVFQAMISIPRIGGVRRWLGGVSGTSRTR